MSIHELSIIRKTLLEIAHDVELTEALIKRSSSELNALSSQALLYEFIKDKIDAIKDAISLCTPEIPEAFTVKSVTIEALQPATQPEDIPF